MNELLWKLSNSTLHPTSRRFTQIKKRLNRRKGEPWKEIPKFRK